MRIVIIGGPRTGKTSYADSQAKLVAGKVYHTDDLIPMGWSEASEEAAGWLEAPGPWVIEGVAAVRALRKWLKNHEHEPAPGRPCDVIQVMLEPHAELSTKQAQMAKGVETVWDEIEHELAQLGVRIDYVIV